MRKAHLPAILPISVEQGNALVIAHLDGLSQKTLPLLREGVCVGRCSTQFAASWLLCKGENKCRRVVIHHRPAGTASRQKSAPGGLIHPSKSLERFPLPMSSRMREDPV